MIDEYKEIKRTKLFFKLDEKWVKKWNSDLEWINSQIDRKDLKNNTIFYWKQLMQQEMWMWCRQTNPVYQEEIDYLSERRGFNEIQKQYLIDLLKYIDLYRDRKEIDNIYTNLESMSKCKCKSK